MYYIRQSINNCITSELYADFIRDQLIMRLLVIPSAELLLKLHANNRKGITVKFDSLSCSSIPSVINNVTIETRKTRVKNSLECFAFQSKANRNRFESKCSLVGYLSRYRSSA